MNHSRCTINTTDGGHFRQQALPTIPETPLAAIGTFRSRTHPVQRSVTGITDLRRSWLV